MLGTWLLVAMQDSLAMQGAAAPERNGAEVEEARSEQRSARAWPGLPPGAPIGVWIENLGQWPRETRFLARVGGGLARIERDSIALQIEGSDGSGRLVRLHLDAALMSEAHVEAPLEPRFHFFIGNDPERWVSQAKAYPRVGLGNGSESSRVWVRADALGVALESGGEVALAWEDLASQINDGCESAGDDCQHEWVATSEEGQGSQAGARPRFRLVRQLTGPEPAGGGSLGAWGSPSPSLLWSTYLGGSGDDATSSCAWADGAIVVGGRTSSGNFPKTPGAYQNAQGGADDCVVVKFREADGRLLYSSVFGDSFGDEGVLDIAMNAVDRPTMVVYTHGPDFPTTPGAFQRTKQSSLNKLSGVVLQLTADGSSLIFSTYLEGPLTGSFLLGINCSDDGSYVVTGAANRDFPTTAGAFSTQIKGQMDDAVVCRLNSSGTRLLWSTFVGGSQGEGGYQVLETSSGVLVGGVTSSNDFPTTPGAFKQTHTAQASAQVFLTELNASGSALNWSTYVGGRFNAEDLQWGGMAIDPVGNIVLSGTYENGIPGAFPTTEGTIKPRWPQTALTQGFIFALEPTSQTVSYSTFFGGPVYGNLGELFIDSSGVITCYGPVSGSATRFPLTPGAFDITHGGGNDVCVFRLAPRATKLFYSTLLGGIAGDSCSQLLGSPAGRTTASLTIGMPGGYPTTPNALAPNWQGGQFDGAVTTFDLFLKGLNPKGDSTPSCKGPLQINGTEMPAEGASTFGLWCSGAPPLSSGFLLLGDLLSSPILWNGVELWIDPAAPFVREVTTSDEAGYAEIGLPIASGTQGQILGAQYFFLGTPACGGALTWSASHALEIAVQPAP